MKVLGEVMTKYEGDKSLSEQCISASDIPLSSASSPRLQLPLISSSTTKPKARFNTKSFICIYSSIICQFLHNKIFSASLNKAKNIYPLIEYQLEKSYRQFLLEKGQNNIYKLIISKCDYHWIQKRSLPHVRIEECI